MECKVVHILGVLNRGGAETLVMNILRNIDREKVKFTFVAYAKGNEHSYEQEILGYGCKIHYLPQLSLPNPFKFIISWFLFLKKSNHDIFHFHITSTSIIPILLSKLFNKKTIVHGHCTNRPNNYKKFVKMILVPPLKYSADYYCACGIKAAKWLLGKRLNSLNNFSVIANGVDTNTFIYNQSLRKQYKAELKINDRLVFGHVGRFEAQKNHTLLIDIFDKVYRKNNNAVLLLIGGGPLEEEIKNKVERLSLSEAVQFLGVRSDIPSLMNAMDVFVFPSLYEGLPVTLVEAQATGLPCLVSDTVSEESKITSLCKFIPLNDVNQWADACLAKQPERGDTSAEIHKAGYSISSSVEKLQSIYSKLIDSKYS